MNWPPASNLSDCFNISFIDTKIEPELLINVNSMKILLNISTANTDKKHCIHSGLFFHLYTLTM